MLHNIEIILRWISKHWFPEILEVDRNYLTDYWIKLIYKWYRKNGASVTIKRIKLLRLITTRYMCGSPLMVNDQMVGVTPDGFPKSLLPFKALMDSGRPQSIRFVLTCLGVSRSFPTAGSIDYTSITKPFTGKYKTIDPTFVEQFVLDYTGHFNPLINRPSPWSSFLSLKSGPLGGPAILAAQVAASRFTGMNLRGLSGIGGDRFMEWIKALKSSITVNLSGIHKFSLEEISLKKLKWGNRRFIHISDPEMKLRIVGCYDYLSQLAFNPLSEWLFNCLRNIPNDRTFTQDPFIGDKDNINNYHSLDLSAATDRFPVELQCQLLTSIAGPHYASSWKNLMVSEPFLGHSFPKGKGCVYDYIPYKVGQPMGARSSWAMFTVTHHMVVQYAAYLNNMYPFKEYILLGDDIVIYNDIVAQSYKDLMDDFGVEISVSKSHVSHNSYEFAKRWFKDGIEVSPIPIAGFINNIKQPKLLYSQILDLMYNNRGPRSIINSIDLAVSLISWLKQDVSGEHSHKNGRFELGHGFYNHAFFDKMSLHSLYSLSEIKYYSRTFKELNLVFRNLKDIDYEATRRFFAESTSGNEYIIPPDLATLSLEWVRTSSGVVNSMAMSVVRNLSLFYKNFKEIYPSATLTKATETGSTPMDLHPLTFAIYNSIKTFSKMNKDLGYTTDLSKQLETVTVLDLDKLSTHERTSVNLVFSYSTLGRKLANQLKQDPYLYIAKARTMQFGRSLFDIQLQMQREYPVLKRDNV